jgi:hypothetical protein
MKPRAVVGIDGESNHRRNRSVHILTIVDVGGGGVVGFQIFQKITAPGRGNCQGSSNGMEVEALRRIVKREEDDQKVAIAVTDQDSEMANVIRESSWNVGRKSDANCAKKPLLGYCQELPKEERQLLYRVWGPARDWFNHLRYHSMPQDNKIETRENTLNHYCRDYSTCHHRAHHG